MTKNKHELAHPVDVYVGSMLRKFRLMRGMSQGLLADYVNLTFQQIQKYERGLNRISCSKLYEFAKHLGINIGRFFDGLPQQYCEIAKANLAGDEDMALADINSNGMGYLSGGNPSYNAEIDQLLEGIDEETVSTVHKFMNLEAKRKAVVAYLIDKLSKGDDDLNFF
jgi:transcriptional regulator with XRE-family HTH domain